MDACMLGVNSDGRIIYANQMACGLLGCTKECLLGQAFQAIAPSMAGDAWPLPRGIETRKTAIARRSFFSHPILTEASAPKFTPVIGHSDLPHPLHGHRHSLDIP